jgi:hypothetical protein
MLTVIKATTEVMCSVAIAEAREVTSVVVKEAVREAAREVAREAVKEEVKEEVPQDMTTIDTITKDP